MQAFDGKTNLYMLAYEAPPKIRLLRSLSIHGSDGMQVLDFGVYPEPEYDLPIFCANFFSSSTTSIVVLDLNPLHDVVENDEYREKYYKSLLPVYAKYADLLPWGGKLTSESVKFFSPIVIWTRFSTSPYLHDVLYSAFKDYLKAWLLLSDFGEKETNPSGIIANQEAQHRYLAWREEKDPGYNLLKRLVGEAEAKTVVRNFLFQGVNTLGTKSFLDYFPEYRCEDGTINEKRSMMGKSFERCPWNSRGEFIGS
ncbi:hypothetical protein SAY86_017073 [Trapa natans]|uniref:Phytochromobilin synthase n=1 Tax=Trapa natans TaxID=22666 RepID=A0AAN7R2D6_TRANT|nr:hypothetical protein SAY86_017073 [Trapa natans]